MGECGTESSGEGQFVRLCQGKKRRQGPLRLGTKGRAQPLDTNIVELERQIAAGDPASVRRWEVRNVRLFRSVVLPSGCPSGAPAQRQNAPVGSPGE
jgi:hypothetical protein